MSRMDMFEHAYVERLPLRVGTKVIVRHDPYGWVEGEITEVGQELYEMKTVYGFYWYRPNEIKPS